ncbi:hypothetical protein K438DRAFT_1794645 [Mycena galopus ATCC 62051]|nr:hypothetical protein K438DRAFT_1794645 [Mycena galopus ATCC 62051]
MTGRAEKKKGTDGEEGRIKYRERGRGVGTSARKAGIGRHEGQMESERKGGRAKRKSKAMGRGWEDQEEEKREEWPREGTRNVKRRGAPETRDTAVLLVEADADDAIGHAPPGGKGKRRRATHTKSMPPLLLQPNPPCLCLYPVPQIIHRHRLLAQAPLRARVARRMAALRPAGPPPTMHASTASSSRGSERAIAERTSDNTLRGQIRRFGQKFRNFFNPKRPKVVARWKTRFSLPQKAWERKKGSDKNRGIQHFRDLAFKGIIRGPLRRRVESERLEKECHAQFGPFSILQLTVQLRATGRREANLGYFDNSEAVRSCPNESPLQAVRNFNTTQDKKRSSNCQSETKLLGVGFSYRAYTRDEKGQSSKAPSAKNKGAGNSRLKNEKGQVSPGVLDCVLIWAFNRQEKLQVPKTKGAGNSRLKDEIWAFNFRTALPPSTQTFLLPDNHYILLILSLTGWGIHIANGQRPTNKLDRVEDKIKSVNETLKHSVSNIKDRIREPPSVRSITTYEEFVQYLQEFPKIMWDIMQTAKKVEEIRKAILRIIEAERQREFTAGIEESHEIFDRVTSSLTRCTSARTRVSGSGVTRNMSYESM